MYVTINESNVTDYIGRAIRAEKSRHIIEGTVLGRSDALVADKDCNPIHPTNIETSSEIIAVDLSDGWMVTLQ